VPKTVGHDSLVFTKVFSDAERWYARYPDALNVADEYREFWKTEWTLERIVVEEEIP
jgi:hypothetical protein